MFEILNYEHMQKDIYGITRMEFTENNNSMGQCIGTELKRKLKI